MLNISQWDWCQKELKPARRLLPLQSFSNSEYIHTFIFVNVSSDNSGSYMQGKRKFQVPDVAQLIILGGVGSVMLVTLKYNILDNYQAKDFWIVNVFGRKTPVETFWKIKQ